MWTFTYITVDILDIETTLNSLHFGWPIKAVFACIAKANSVAVFIQMLRTSTLDTSTSRSISIAWILGLLRVFITLTAPIAVLVRIQRIPTLYAAIGTLKALIAMLIQIPRMLTLYAALIEFVFITWPLGLFRVFITPAALVAILIILDAAIIRFRCRVLGTMTAQAMCTFHHYPTFCTMTLIDFWFSFWAEV